MTTIQVIVKILTDSGIEENEANVEVKLLLEHFADFSAKDLILGKKLTQNMLEIVKEKAPAKKREKGAGRMVLPENLRREIIIIEPTEDVTGCTIIGEEITEVLDLIPAEFFVKRYIRYKYARANGEGIITASLPDRVIDKGIPSEAIIAQMVVDKYVFGLC
jgi:hypothetical protein